MDKSIGYFHFSYRTKYTPHITFNDYYTVTLIGNAQELYFFVAVSKIIIHV